MRDGYYQESDLDNQVIECPETLQGNHKNKQIKASIINCLNSLALRPKAVPGRALFWFCIHLDKFWHMFLIKSRPPPWLQDMAGISVLWGSGACRAESAGHDGQKRCAFLCANSRDSTPASERCIVVNENGTTINVFDYRNPNSLLFQKVPNGEIVLNYSRTFGIDLTLYQERSAPIW